MTQETVQAKELLHSPPFNVRQFNIMHSPKKGGNSDTDSRLYLDELKTKIIDNPQSIQFTPNSTEILHRWSPYIQGFSAQFVQKMIDRFGKDYKKPTILDPFTGSGTVLTQAKINNLDSYGVEINPLLHFIAETKLNSWDVNPELLLKIALNLAKSNSFSAPEFLKSEKHFNKDVLKNLESLKSSIDTFLPETQQEQKIKNLMLLAFSAILIDASNMKRSPCLGYSRNKNVDKDAPLRLFENKMKEISFDLSILQQNHKDIKAQSKVWLDNSMSFDYTDTYDLAITSPPYMNGLDYVINYKIEMGWLGFARDQKELKHVKNEMVVCDNVSKGLIRDFSSSTSRYSNEWIENIKEEIALNIERRGAYRRTDMPEIVHKYFDDMYKIMKRVVGALESGGRFILVVGDSLIADTYLPTDLLLVRIGQELGLTIESIEKARNRRSGQIRSYKLRETIAILKKE